MKVDNGTISSAKVYADVDAHFCKDGRRFEIDKVTQVARRASMKAGGCGIRYTCIVEGKQGCLFYEVDKWFVERKTA